MKFEVTLRIKVEAETSVDALDIAIGAAERLIDTFNDDGSIDPLIGVESKPVQPQGVPA